VQNITAQGLTDVGQQRDHNEDAFACDDDMGFYVVCDGMGGHASGEVASSLAVAEVMRLVGERLHAAGSGEVSEALIRDAVGYANERVFVQGMKDAKTEGMGTTIVALLPRAEEIVLAHVGDSRIYRLNLTGRLDLLTRDHSLLNEKIDTGELSTADDIAGFKQTNVISRALGVSDVVKVDTRRVPRRRGDIFLLCTDGLTDLVDDDDIQAVLEGNRQDLTEALDCLVRMSNARGGKDNITVLAVRVDDDDEFLAETIQNTSEAFEQEEADATLPESSREEEEVFSETETTPNIPRVSSSKRTPGKPAKKVRSKIPPVQVVSGSTEVAGPGPAPRWADGPSPPTVVVKDESGG
jgi:serine/threonine protein phosphatase PrpC